MKTVAVLTLSLVAAAFADDPKPNPVKEPDTRSKPQQTEEVKRLGSVTWNLETHKLVWVVQKGAMVNGEFVPDSEQKYEISPDQARMAVEEEKRGFDDNEAVSLHHLLDVLSLYCAESVVWWDQGQGSPVTDKPRVDKKNGNKKGAPGDKPVRVKYKAPAGQAVALAAPPRQ